MAGGILGTLHDTRQRKTAYVWKAGLISLLPSLLITTIVGLLLPEAERPEFTGPLPILVFEIVVLAPWLETLLMWAVFGVLGLFIRRQRTLIAVSALLWAGLHSLAHPVWGLGVFWPFWVFSTAFVKWRQRSLREAIAVTAAIHMCQNSLGLLIPVFAWFSQRRPANATLSESPPPPEPEKHE